MLTTLHISNANALMVAQGFWPRHCKRFFDIVILLATSPIWGALFLLIALVVRVTSAAPIIFRQERVGYQGRIFHILKFRTMHAHVLPVEGGMFKSWTYFDDPRVTRVGRHMRKWRLDEIPQFINIFKGEMSLVGPRPETREVVVGLSAQFEEYPKRHRVRPGLSGLCQVSPEYLRFSNYREIQAKLALDLQYIQRCSLSLDLYILCRTAVVLLSGRGVV